MTINKRKQYKNGQAVLLTVLFLAFITSAMIIGIANPIIKQVRIGNDILNSKNGFFLAESSSEDVLYRLQKRKTVDNTEVLLLNGGTATTTNTNTSTGKEIITIADYKNNIRKTKTVITLGTGVAFNYGVQAGQGGFTLSNSSSINGNVFSLGSIIGSSGNDIYGDVISAGSSGLVYGIHATGSVYARTIGNASKSTTVDKNAYYQTKINTTVGGTSYPNSQDQELIDLPISDELIDQWKSEAQAGGVISSCDGSGNYTITSNVTIGPVKIACNLVIKSSNAIVTVAGHVWVEGDISFQTGPTMKMATSLGSTNVAIIADKPSNRTGSGKIDVGQSTVFQGSGSSGSFVFLISQNNSAETGGSNVAISMSQGASALVAYAGHGLVTLSQSVSLKEVTAYKINLSQSANVVYDRGLPNTLFQGGPSGGYEVLSWEEIR